MCDGMRETARARGLNSVWLTTQGGSRWWGCPEGRRGAADVQGRGCVQVPARTVVLRWTGKGAGSGGPRRMGNP